MQSQYCHCIGLKFDAILRPEPCSQRIWVLSLMKSLQWLTLQKLFWCISLTCYLYVLGFIHIKALFGHICNQLNTLKRWFRNCFHMILLGTAKQSFDCWWHLERDRERLTISSSGIFCGEPRLINVQQCNTEVLWNISHDGILYVWVICFSLYTISTTWGGTYLQNGICKLSAGGRLSLSHIMINYL